MMTLRSLTSCLAFVRRNLIWFLMATYGLAAWVPGPGDRVRHLDLGELPFTNGRLNPTHLMLGVLLFCVGVSIRSEESRNLWRLSRAVVWGLIGAWLVPLLGLGLMFGLDPFASGLRGWEEFLAGAALVVAMPPANSSSIWCEISGGQAAATVSIIILATLVSPLLTPLILSAFAGLRGATDVAAPDTAASLEILVAFVVLPTGLGMAVRTLSEAVLGVRLQSLLATCRSVAIVTLLGLNYTNAAVAAPELVAEAAPVSAVMVSLLSVLLCVIVFAAAVWVSPWICGSDPGRRAGFVYVTGMKNTGAALVLAASLFSHQPLAILVPIFYTIAQHLAAALTDRSVALTRRGLNAETLGVAPAPPPGPTISQASTPSY